MDEYLEKIGEGISELSHDLSMLSELDIESLNAEDVRRYINELQNAASRLAELEEKVEAPITEDVTEISMINKNKEQLNELRNKFNINELIEKYANKKIEDYVKTIETAENTMRKVLASFNSDFSELHEITDEISDLVTEYEKLKNQVNDIIGLINEVNNPYVVSPKELKDRLEKIKNGIKIIKNKQINNYNRMVTALNNRLDIFARELERLPENVRNQVISMFPYPRLEMCNMEVTRYNQTNYLSALNYEELKRQLLLSVEIEKALDNRKLEEEKPEDKSGKEGPEHKPTPSGGESEPPVPPVDATEALEAELTNIENKIVELNESYKEEMTYAELYKFVDQIDYIENLLEVFITNLYESEESVKNNESFAERVKKCQESLDNIKNRLLEKKKEVIAETTEYNDLLNRLERLENKVGNTVDMLMEPAFEDKKVSQNAIDIFKNNLNKLDEELRASEEEIRKLHEDGVLNDEQYKNLVDKIEKIKENITNGRTKTEAFETLKETGFFDFLNGEMAGLETAISQFETALDVTYKPINKQNRKLLDNMYKEILKDIDRIESNLEKYKDIEPEKYQSEMEKLNGHKERLEELNKKYHSKCGFFVRKYRSAKKFYKKHKKVVLLATGIAAFALLAQPVIIPALMHGIELIAGASPALAGVGKINTLLAKAIGASLVDTTVNGVGVSAWRFANGLMLTPVHTSTSLLKGIAMATGNAALLGAGNGAIIGAVILALKKFTNKMNNKESKKDKTRLRTVVKDTTDTLKQKGKSLVDGVKEHNAEMKLDKIRKEIKNLPPEIRQKLLQSFSEEERKELETDDASLESMPELEEEARDEAPKGRVGR